MILWVKISKTDERIELAQSHFTEKSFKKFGQFVDEPMKTHYDSSARLKKHIGESVSQLEYSQIKEAWCS